MEDLRKKHQDEVDKNYDAFKKILNTIIIEHNGEYALMKDGGIVEYFTTYDDAIKAGNVKYEDKIFSVQKVEDKSISLGYFSYA